MLYWLFFEKLFRLKIFTPFRVFQYATFRTAFASLTALFLCIALGPWLIERLRRLNFGQHIREDGPRSHMKKAGTPTMGGVLIVVSVVFPTLLWANYTKIKRMRNLGMTARQKILYQVIVAVISCLFLLMLHGRGAYSTALNVPFFKTFKPDQLINNWLHSYWTYPLAFVGFYAFTILVLVGSSNAVNLTDGLDGLAIGLMIIAAGAMTVLTYVTGHARFAEYLGLDRVPGASELAIFCGALTGASIGFLWYNAHPAEVFMGDVGSLALGGSLGMVTVLIKQELLLPFIGGVYVIEALSVILQVGSYKLRGKRIFKMAPLHHHFEAKGWQESKIITRFWIAGLVMALFALTTLKLR